MLGTFFKTLKISATVLLLAGGLANSTLRPQASFMLLDVLGQGLAIYVIWFMGGRKPNDDLRSDKRYP